MPKHIPNVEHCILNLVAGVQSMALYLMFKNGNITPQIEAAIFADTGDEPGAEQRRLGLPDPEGSIYAHLDWLVYLNGPPILVRSKGQLSADLMRVENSTGQRVASIPAFTQWAYGDVGKTRRQCSSEYKIQVIERTIRREICAAAPKKRIPKGHTVIQYIGISIDEIGRACRVMRNAVKDADKVRAKAWGYPQLVDYFRDKTWRYVFPLVDHNVNREDCKRYLAQLVPHVTPRSACTFCPFHDDREWDRLKREDPIGFARAVTVDEALRTPGNIVNRNMDQPMFLHRSCQPLALVQFDTRPRPTDQQSTLNFAAECLGVCGV